MVEAEPCLILDAGALIAYERMDRRVIGLIEVGLRRDLGRIVSSGVVAQVWRGSARQARLARLLKAELVTEVALDAEAARAVGVRCAESDTSDVVDGHVAVLADEHGARIVTSDPEDLIVLGIDRGRLVVV